MPFHAAPQASQPPWLHYRSRLRGPAVLQSPTPRHTQGSRAPTALWPRRREGSRLEECEECYNLGTEARTSTTQTRRHLRTERWKTHKSSEEYDVEGGKCTRRLCSGGVEVQDEVEKEEGGGREEGRRWRCGDGQVVINE
ncbi:hypothetical protein E2C01_081741 [Portunus trituberculatus]|uniref:Uncharacterized protein n=1 Tax=Portunus trituberculatus TaxID=210409 RepID=A0A5B7IXG0_PORTR|nr:hypothetical protein [Portunus trituberculatus]